MVLKINSYTWEAFKRVRDSLFQEEIISLHQVDLKKMISKNETVDCRRVGKRRGLLVKILLFQLLSDS